VNDKHEKQKFLAINEKVGSRRLLVVNIWRPEDIDKCTTPPLTQKLIPLGMNDYELSDLCNSTDNSSLPTLTSTSNEEENGVHFARTSNKNFNKKEEIKEDTIYDFPVMGFKPQPLKSSLAGSRSAVSFNSSPRTAQSSNKRLTFLTTLEAIPQEMEVLTMKRLAKTIHISLNNPKILYPSLITFCKLLQDVCRRANYWSWAPNFIMFLALFINGKLEIAVDEMISRYAIYLFSFFCCSICKYDSEREPALYSYFVNFCIPQLMDTAGKWKNPEFDPSLLTLSYIFFKVPIDQEVLEIVIAIRNKRPADFFANAHEDLRYQRAFWLSAISHQLVLSIKRGENIEACKTNILQCYKEAMLSHKSEKSPRVAKVYETYFDIKSKE
jgi:hypothetical protein